MTSTKLLFSSFVFSFLFTAGFAQSTSTLKMKYNPSLSCAQAPGADQGMSIKFDQSPGKTGENISRVVSVKTPARSTEIFNFNDGTNNSHNLNIECDGLIIKGAKIKTIKFSEVIVKLPEGSKNVVSASTNAKDLMVTGGEEICVKISGIPDIPGKIGFDFVMDAKASLGFTIKRRCTVSNGYLNIL